MESFMSAIFTPRAESATDKAQDVMYEGRKARSANGRWTERLRRRGASLAT
jgi:hypothetical protein